MMGMGSGKTGRMLWVLAVVLFAAGCLSSRPNRQETVMKGLESQLYSGDSRTANRAALVLLSYDSDDALKLVKKALLDTSPSTTRAAVISAFTNHEDARIKAEALHFLSDDNDEIVALSETYLAEVVGEGAAPDLLAAAKDSKRSERERVAALEVLGKIGTSATVEGLLGLLDDPNNKIATATTAALQGITYQPFGGDAATWRSWFRQNRRLSREQWRQVGGLYATGKEERDKQISALEVQVSERDGEIVARCKQLVDLAAGVSQYDLVIDVLNTARPVEAKIYAAQALGNAKVAQAAEALIRNAGSLDVNLSRACVDALGQIADPHAEQVVALNLSASNVELRLSAVGAYCRLPESDMALLLPLRSDPSSQVRAAVMSAFGTRRWSEGYNALVGALSDQSSDVRTAAAGALGLLGNKTAVGPLMALVKDESEKVRWAAVTSLSQLGDPASFDALVEATRDEVPGVKQAAVVALAKLGDKRAVDRLLEMTITEPSPLVADQAWTSLGELVRDDERLTLTLADSLEKTGRSSRAESMLKTLADGASASDQAFEARMRLARGYLAAGNFPAAAAYYRKVLDARSDNIPALVGLGSAYKGQGDWAGMAGLYARPIIAKQATAEIKGDYLTALRELSAAKDFATAVASAKQVLGFDLSPDKEFQAALSDVYAKALSLYIRSLVATLGSQDEAARAAAKNALAAYGRSAGEALVDGLNDQSTDVRVGSMAILTPLSGGHDFGFDPKKDPAAQQGAVVQWRGWLAGAGPQAQ